MKPDMGIFMIKSKVTNKVYLEVTPNLKGKINSARFQLKAGSHPHKELQQDWSREGEANFTIEILEKLNYDKDESKTDYSGELEVLEFLWKEKLLKHNIELYNK